MPYGAEFLRDVALQQTADRRPPMVVLQHRSVLRGKRKKTTPVELGGARGQRPSNTYLVKSGQVIAGRDKERLIDAGMVEIVRDGRYEGRHYFQRCQVVLNLRNDTSDIIYPIQVTTIFADKPAGE